MPMSAAEKQQVIAEYRRGEGDTGSPEVQVALLTARIKQLTGHFSEHKHDSKSELLLPIIATGYDCQSIFFGPIP